MKHYIIGAGGVGSWLASMHARMKPAPLVIIDKDKLEDKNLDRQLFSKDEIGSFKAEALASRLGCEHVNEWYRGGLLNHEPTDVIFCAADNHAARVASMISADLYGCTAIIGGNEYTDSEAYYYEPSFAGTVNDPRVRWPEMVLDHSDDPTRPEGCTGDAAIKKTPQLVLANNFAACHMLWLWWYHEKIRTHVSDQPTLWPIWVKNSASRFTTTKFKNENVTENTAAADSVPGDGKLVDTAVHASAT